MAASYAGNSGNKIYAAVWEHGLFYSNDDGKTWSKRNHGLGEDENGNISISSLAVHPKNSEIAWVTIENFGIIKIADRPV